MTTTWSAIRARRQFSDADEAEIRDAQTEMDREETAYNLAQLRKHRQHTQVRLAQALGIDDTTVSRNERSADPHVSTVRSCVEALGGCLHLVAEFDDEEIRLDI